jgi:hypothetical protein
MKLNGYQLVCESLHDNGTLKSQEFSGEYLLWDQLITFLHTIKKVEILNTTVSVQEHHHFRCERFYPEFEIINNKPVLIPNARYMSYSHKWELTNTSPYYEKMHSLDKKYPISHFPNSCLTYKHLIEMVSKFGLSRLHNTPIQILDIWNDMPQVPKDENDLIHLEPKIGIMLDELLRSIEEAKNNPHWSEEQKKTQIDNDNNRIKELQEGKHDGNIDYFIEHPEQPLLGYYEN